MFIYLIYMFENFAFNSVCAPNEVLAEAFRGKRIYILYDIYKGYIYPETISNEQHIKNQQLCECFVPS